jgi:aminoglycoside phosphotransferase (APT) family kinase protein
MPFTELTSADATALLAEVGIDFSPEGAIERRGERWLVRLPEQRVAWFAASQMGRDTLVADRSVLRMIETRCDFRAPRILVEHSSGDFDVRAMVPGTSDPVALFNAASGSPTIARQIGTQIGSMVEELHTKIAVADIENLIQRKIQHKPDFPESRAWILERLPRVIDDRAFIAKSDDVLRRCESLRIDDEDRVLIHGDLGMHALAYDPDSFRINGLFDFEGAACADRHHDFRYLILGNSTTMLDAALSEYESITHCILNRDRILLYHAACALSYLAFRVGHAPEEESCGRTLEGDLKWSREAVGAIG